MSLTHIILHVKSSSYIFMPLTVLCAQFVHPGWRSLCLLLFMPLMAPTYDCPATSIHATRWTSNSSPWTGRIGVVKTVLKRRWEMVWITVNLLDHLCIMQPFQTIVLQYVINVSFRCITSMYQDSHMCLYSVQTICENHKCLCPIQTGIYFVSDSFL